MYRARVLPSLIPAAAFGSLALSGPAAAAELWGAPRVVGGHCEAPVFSQFGEQLAYTLNHHELCSIETWAVQLPDGTPQPITVAADGPGAPAAFGSRAPTVVHGLSWAPAPDTTSPFRGQFVVSASDSRGEFELYSSQGSQPISPAPGHDGDPAWNPVEETSLVWSSARTGEGDLYTYSFVDHTPRRLTTLTGSAEVDAAWSSDGTHLAYVAHTSDGDNIWILDDLSGAAPRRLTRESSTQVRPQWSPAGPHRIAYYRYPEGQSDQLNHVDLVVATSNGGARVLATGVVADSRGPSWTPDGTAIIAVLDDPDRFNPVVRIDAKDGSVVTLPTDTVGNTDLSVIGGLNGQTLLAVCAQGRTADAQRDYRRVFVFEL